MAAFPLISVILNHAGFRYMIEPRFVRIHD